METTPNFFTDFYRTFKKKTSANSLFGMLATSKSLDSFFFAFALLFPSFHPVPTPISSDSFVFSSTCISR